jgi:hypothetical protein
MECSSASKRSTRSERLKAQFSAMAPSSRRTVVSEDWALVALVGRAG